MKNKLYLKQFIFLLIFTILIVVSCTNRSGIPMVVINSAKNDFALKIMDWQIIGPFLEDNNSPSKVNMNGNPGLYYDFLKDFGYSEGEIKASDVIGIRKANSVRPEILTDDFMNKSVNDTSKNIDFTKYFKNTNNSTVYVFCEIYSPIEQDVVFITGSDDGIKAFLNNKIIINKPLLRAMHDYQDIGMAHLRKGKNLFFAKIYNSLYDWGLHVSIYSYSKAREVLMANNLLKILEKGIFHIGDSLKFNVALFPTKSINATLTIRDFMENKILSKNFGLKDTLNINLSKFHNGIYSAQVEMDSSIIEQLFYYGNNADSLLARYRVRSKIFKDDQTIINLNALLIRYEHLINPENIDLNDSGWQSKLILIIKELETILYDLENGRQAFSDKIGLHLRGYRSNIDNQEQFYKVYVPHQYKNATIPLPVVIIIPTITAPIRHFLKSVHVADISLETEYIFQASEKYGYIVLWSNARGYNFGNPVETSEVFEVLEAAKKNYNIDIERIYLSGTCTGGLAALALGLRYPSLFAGIGIFSPYTHQRDPQSSSLDIPNSAYNSWLEMNNPILYTNNFNNLPIYDIHGEKNHAPLSESIAFIDSCKRSGISPYFKVIYNEINPGIFGADFTMFDFFKGKIREKNPKKIDFSTSQLKYNSAYWITINKTMSFSKKSRVQADHTISNLIVVKTENISQFEIHPSSMEIDKTRPLKVITNGVISFNGSVSSDNILINVLSDSSQNSKLFKNHDTEGPIMDVFSRSFLLVDCDNLSESKNKEMSLPCESFIKAWKRDFFVDGCRYKKASAVQQIDLEEQNLVLFGNPVNNILIKKILNRIPIKFYSDSIILSGKVFRGKNLGVQMIYPNPLNNKNYILLISSNNWKNFNIPEMNLSLEGWYDFVIWETSLSGSRKILDVGYFDSDWNKLISLQ